MSQEQDELLDNELAEEESGELLSISASWSTQAKRWSALMST